MKSILLFILLILGVGQASAYSLNEDGYNLKVVIPYDTSTFSGTEGSYEISLNIYNGEPVGLSSEGGYNLCLDPALISYTCSFLSVKTSPTIIWSNPTDITYGTPLSSTQLNAVASVAGTYVYTPASGTVLGAGTQTLHVDFMPTDAVNYTIASKDVTINTLKAPLIVTADDKSKVYGAPLPSFTASYNGFVLGEDPDVLGGTLIFTTAATASSPVGIYGVTPSGLTSFNYTIAFKGGTLTVIQADTVTAVSSSANPSILGQPVTFTATVNIVPPGAGAFTGSVEFFNGTTSLGTVPLSGTNAMITTSALGVGANSIKATYSGDGYFNPSTSSVLTQQIMYNFTGFFQPVDNPPTLNIAKAGSAIPVKFSLSGYQGLNIFPIGYPISMQINCLTNAPTSSINETVTAGQSGLSYNSTTDQYNYVWKTNSAWSTGTCRQLTVMFIDGTYHNASFQFK